MDRDGGRQRAGGRRLTLAMLVIAYTLNFVDRQIVGILAMPIKGELGLTDTQLGLMGGVAFALFYSTLGVPIALLADRTSRAGVIAAALAVWSGFTALCGAATGFWSLFLARVGVGIGEAGGVAPSYALVASHFPGRERARALAIFTLGSPLGSAIGIFFGGWVAVHFDWRVAFVVVGLAGIAFAPIFRLLVRDPASATHGAAATSRSPTIPGAPASAERGVAPPIREVWRVLARTPAFWWLSLGAASTSLVGYGLLFWLPSFFTRSHGLTLLEASRIFGAIVLVGGLTGTWAGGWLADRLGARSRRAYALVPAVAVALAAPFYALGTLSNSLAGALVLFLIPHALGMMWLGPVAASVQQIVPPAMRATASAVFLLVLNLVGIGGGALLFGVLSDVLTPRFGAEALRWSILIGLSFYLVAAGLFFAASRRLAEAWRD